MRWIIVWIMLTGAVWAQELRSVTFLTDPPGASLYDYQQAYLGRSGEPIALDLSKYGDGLLELTARLDGYEPAQFSVKTPELQPGAKLPQRGPVKLVPLVTPLGWLRERALPTLALVGLGGALGGVLMGRRRVAQERRRRQELLSDVDQSDSLAAQQLGPWRLLQRVGRGGMATVYRAVPETSMNEAEAVAVKVMRKDIVADPEFLERFRREARVTKALDHPNVVRLIDWGEERGYAYMVMELIQGGNLRERLQARAVPPAEAWAALQPICAGLACAHAAGIVHRDLKPENLMITESGLLKVTDFGLARARDLKTKLTATGTVLGTPAYMAPEQIHGEPPTPAMDQYAVGVIAYELLTGHLPHSDPDPVRQIFMTLTETARPPSELATLSPAIDDVVMRMLNKDPRDRYPTLSDAADALERVLAR